MQLPRRDDVIAQKNGNGFVTRYAHDDVLRHTGESHVANRRPAEVMHDEPADVMVKAGFVEGRYEERDRKARQQHTGANAWKNHYETIEGAIADGFLDPEEVEA